MKSKEISRKIALIALAAVCLLAVPALSTPTDNCPSRQGYVGMFAPINNLTAEEMNNMTLGELKEMQQQAWNNKTACSAKESGRNGSQMGRNANEYPGMKEKGIQDDQKRDSQKDERKGCMGGAVCGQDDNGGRFDKAPRNKVMDSPIMLLMGDLTVEDLGNMTINQIKELSKKKMQELDGMILAQIKLLQDKKVQERDNMTLNQLKEEKKNMGQIAEILKVLGSGRHIKA